MIVFPNAKINLGLRVTARRPDGYHDLDTVFVPIALKDALEVVECPQGEGCRLHVAATDGTVLDCADADNLVARAYRLLVAEGHVLPPVEVWLTKHIPSGAGLGGGSADAAVVINGLDEFWLLGLSEQRRLEIASEIGSDVPALVLGGAVMMEGRGERVRRLTAAELTRKGDYDGALKLMEKRGDKVGIASLYKTALDNPAKADAIYRGVLSMFRPDGRATCACMFPETVNGRPGNYDDPLANDQDWGLYFALR